MLVHTREPCDRTVFLKLEVIDMSFQFYRFSQSPSVTFVCVVYSVFTMLNIGLGMNIFLSSIIALASFCILFIPIVSIFYPLIFTGYMIASSVILYSHENIYFYIALVVLIITIIRFLFMFLFSVFNPALSRQYDLILRNRK